MTDLLLQNTNEDILKNVGNQTVLVTTDFYCMDKKYIYISQNIFFCIIQKKEVQVWNDIRVNNCDGIIFLGELPLKNKHVYIIPVKCREEATGREHEWSTGQDNASVIYPLQISSRHVCHANCPCWAVQEFISISGKKNECPFIKTSFKGCLCPFSEENVSSRRLNIKNANSLSHGVVEFSNALMRPVLPKLRQNLPEHIWSEST